MNNIGLNSILLQNINGTNAIMPIFYNTLKENNYYTIDYNDMHPDKINIKAIVFEVNSEIINKYIYDIIFTTKINNNIIINTPLSFFINFNTIKRYDNKIVIILNNYFIYDYITYNNEIIYSLEISEELNPYITSIKFLANTTSLTRENKLKLSNYSSKYFNQILFSKNIWSLNNNLKQIINIKNINGYIKGLFIECNDINDLEKIKIEIGGIVRIDYNKILIDCYSHIITNKLMYISFENSENYKSNLIDSFSNSYYMKDMCQFVIAMSFKNVPNLFYIHFVIGYVIDIKDGKYLL
jgi:hypothetical protein